MKTIVVANKKGGVGKSTTAFNLACWLQGKGHKVLMMDLDEQQNLSTMAGRMPNSEGLTIWSAIAGDTPLAEIIMPTEHGDLVPASGMLANANNHIRDEFVLRELLEPVRDRYDYCIIDTAPGLSYLTTAACTAADGVILPAAASILSMSGISDMAGMLRGVQTYSNKNLAVLGILIGHYRGQATVYKDLAKGLEDQAESLGTKVFASRIREAAAVEEACALQKPIFAHKPGSAVAADFDAAFTEIMETLEGAEA